MESPPEEIRQIQEESTKEEINKLQDHKKNLLKITLNNKLELKGTVDTGNTITDSVAISPEVHQALGVGFQTIGGKQVGTAKSGSQLTRLGVSNPIKLNIAGMKKSFDVRPCVIKELSDPCNIGLKFFTDLADRMRCQITFEKDGTSVKIGNEEAEMIKIIGAKPEEVVEAEAKPNRQSRTVKKDEIIQRNREKSIPRKDQIESVYASKDMIVKRDTLTFIPGYVSKDIKGTVLVESAGRTLCEAVEAVHDWKNQENKIAVMNIQDENVVIKKGSEIARITTVRIGQQSKEPITEVPSEKVLKVEDRSEKLLQDLQIEENEMLRSNPEIKQKVKDLVVEYQDVFSEPGNEIGKTNLMEFTLDLKPEARPIRQRLRPLNPKQRESLQKQLEVWKHEGVIEEVSSPWASPLVPALKKGGDIRWAVDYRRLNEVTIADSFPLPSISENLEKLQGSKVFSTLDAAAAYMTIPTSKKCRPYLAFITPNGLFSFKRMPFGAKNSGSTYARFVELCISKLKSQFILAYVDDVIVHTPDLNQHVDELEKVLKMHREAGIKLRAHKTKIFATEADYLGYRVTEKGIGMKDDYIERIIEWPTPSTVKELNTFLGFVGYYRSFIDQFSYLTNEMNAQRKAKKLEWTAIMEEKFRVLKGKFKSKPIRSYPRYDLEELFELTTDFSAENLGAILSQIQGGKERMIATAGRKTTKFESNYGSVKGELAAIVYGLRKFEHILRFRRFIVNTDSGSLKYLQSMKDPRGIQYRWLTEIQSYDFEIRHRPGRLNTNADAISRSGHMPPPSKEEEHEEAEYIAKLQQYLEELETDEDLAEIGEANTQLSREWLIQAQKEDRVLQQVRGWVTEGKIPSNQELKGESEETRAYAQIAKECELKDDLLYFKDSLGFAKDEKTFRILVPEECKEAVFFWSHRHPTAGHFGQRATILRAKAKFCYIGLYTDLKRKVSGCTDCLAKITKANVKSGRHKPSRSGFPTEKLFIDLVGPLPVTNQLHKYIVTIEDAFTRHVQAYPIPNKEAMTVAHVLVDRYICTYGMPLQIHSDNGKEFVNKIWDELMDRMQIKKTCTPVYNPQSNNVERFHRTLNQMMRIFTERGDPEWSRYLSVACLAYNTKVNESTGLTPFMAMMGREARMPIDLILPTPAVRGNVQQHVQATLDRFTTMYQFIRKNADAVIRRNAKNYAGQNKRLEVGQKVWYLCPRKIKGKPVKICDQWIGPYTIIEIDTEVLIRIKPSDYEGNEIVVHVARLVPYKDDGSRKRRIPNSVQIDDEDDLAEEIRADRFDENPMLGIPVSVPVPDEIIVDLPKQRKVQAERSTQVEQQVQIEIPSGEGPSQAVTAPNEDMEVKEQAAAPKRPRAGTDGEAGTSKQPKLRPKRSRAELEAERDKRKLSQELPPSTTEDETLKPKKQRPAWKNYLSEESESTDTIQSIQVGIDRSSDCPRKSTPGSAAYDITAAQGITVPASSCRPVLLNLRLEIPDGYCLLLQSRSGLALKGITVIGGIIDSDFKGEIRAIVQNSSRDPFRIQKGQRITQGVFLNTLSVQFDVTDITDDGAHTGFGSTGDFVTPI